MTNQKIPQHGHEGLVDLFYATKVKGWDSRDREKYLENIATDILLHDVCNHLVYKASDKKKYH